MSETPIGESDFGKLRYEMDDALHGLNERLKVQAKAMTESGAYIPPPPKRVSPAPPISTIAGTTVMITPQQRYEFRLDFGKRISHLTLTERDALELIQRLRQSITAARKAQQVTP